MTRDERVAAVVAAWADVPRASKYRLLLGWPRLYFAVAKLVADDAVRSGR